MSKRAVVTGGSGFVGQHLCQALLDAGYEVYDIDLVGPRTTLRGAFEWLEADLLHGPLEALVDWPDADVVYHLAAAPWNTVQGDEYVRTNTFGTVRALELARALKARFVLASSMVVYGPAGHGLFRENDALHPFSPYGYSKWLAESLVRHFVAEYGLRAAILRFANIYGPGHEPYHHLIPDLLRKLTHQAGPFTLLGTGHETRDFIFIDDAVKAYMLAVLEPDIWKDELPAGLRAGGLGVYNVGSGMPMTVATVANHLLVHFATYRASKGWSLEMRFTGQRGPNDVAWEHPRAVSWERLGSLGWRPTVSFTEGLQRSIAAWWALSEKERTVSA